MQSLSYPSYAFRILSLSEIHQAPGSPRAVVSLRGAPSYSLPWIDFYALLFQVQHVERWVKGQTQAQWNDKCDNSVY